MALDVESFLENLTDSEDEDEHGGGDDVHVPVHDIGSWHSPKQPPKPPPPQRESPLQPRQRPGRRRRRRRNERVFDSKGNMRPSPEIDANYAPEPPNLDHSAGGFDEFAAPAHDVAVSPLAQRPHVVDDAMDEDVPVVPDARGQKRKRGNVQIASPDTDLRTPPRVRQRLQVLHDMLDALD